MAVNRARRQRIPIRRAIDTLDPGVGDAPILRMRMDGAGLHAVMSNSFGFSGTNATLIFQKSDQ